ncbi:GNAT family N-acetyltransferase [Mangrovimonas sp. TPBH4]|uniref:GNAT family N-acetyltransferase n=1 Tax=Mangrovimonas sp. TPBH4 TaxID=1645914 RepID=UPI0006B5C073|nr:GNAT family N-acetyltransferase [Mangrovimonas sp. TPBH4]
MNNPFTSSAFVKLWSKYFNENRDVVKFDFIPNVKFFKGNWKPFYINVGKNLTKGVCYNLNYEAKDYKNKVFLVYDIPEYFNVPSLDQSQTDLRCKTIYQYDGFLLDFKDYSTPQEYIKSRISSKNIRGYKSRKRRLEDCFNISYKFHNSDLDRTSFEVLFEQFHGLLTKRFADKQFNYHHLQSNKWEFYREYVFEMLQREQATLFVIYNGNSPIAITLNINSDTIVFVSITVFDTDYYKFNIGKISIIKIIEWCFEHNMKIADFSKGYFDFKEEWGNVQYHFDYHILYDSKSLFARTVAWKLSLFFKFKQYLRQKNVNIFYRRFLFQLKSRRDRLYNTKIKIENIDDFQLDQTFTTVDLDDYKSDYYRKYVYSFLFANPEPIENIKVYKKINGDTLVINGAEKSQRIILN